ncbi:Vacuolar protein sorting-associated protein 13, second N-terminal domain [Phytophthora cactorum]|nr:Vacuolar protein sorting-associated protein 13, second N-terminal domain [Phytophthora cactorum]
MLQHAVALLLQRLLGKFVTFDSSMLKLSLWQGDLSFQDLQLRLSYGDGEIGHLSVKIPWRALWTQPVQIKAQSIRISLHQTPKPQHQAETTELESVDTSIDGSNGDDRTYLSRLVSHIIANVQIELSDVQVRYDCDPSSLAPQPGSGTLEIGHVSLINTNAEWELEFTPQSNSAMESKKLLKTEGVAAYIEYPDKQSTTGPEDELASPKMHRKYLFHEWRSTVKASLYYHSVNAAFPDVELDVDIGCDPGSMTEKCEICAAHDASGNERFVLQANQPRVHFGPEHIDVLYAILIEVKAPYDEYDRLAALTQQQASRPDSFLMVLSYAKQWLLTDCLDAVVGETFTLAADDDDDDDEFEDAITPPSLSVRAELRHGAGIFFSARESVTTEEEIVRGTQWVWILGETVGVVKQSCVEDEIQLCVQSLRMYEVAERSESYSIIDHASQISENNGSAALVTPIVRISCVIPAYQSRLVGHQPALDVQLGSMMTFIKDETLVMWMTLFAPVYLWWNQWNLSHPSKLVTYNDAQIAPIAHLGIKMEKICFVFSLHDHFCFGVELKDLVVETSEPDREFVKSDFRTSVRLFSVDESLALLQAQMALNDVRGLHEILAVNDLSLTKTSHSRAQWSMDYYSCKHCTLGRHGAISYEQRETDCEQETAMYNYEAQLPAIRIDWKMTELEALCWVIGKWSFFLPDKPANGPDRDLHPALGSASVNLVCQRKLSAKTPELRLCVSDDRPDQSSTFVLSIKDVDWSSRVCTTTVTQSVSISSISLQEGESVIVQVAGSPGLRASALSATYHMSRTYSSDPHTSAGMNAPSILRFDRQATRVVISVERLNGELFLPDVRTILTWIGGCHDRYLLGFILSTSFGYELDDLRRNLSKLGSQASSTLLEDSSCFDDEVVVSLSVVHGLQIDVKHRDQTPGASLEGLASIKTIACVEVSSMSLQASGSGAAVCMRGLEIKGSVRNLQLTDLTTPSGSLSADVVLPNRQAIGSPSDMLDGVADVGSFGVKNVVDFVISSSGDTDGGISVRVRLDSVCIVYLHRVFKQFHHYLFDHVLEALVNPLDEYPRCEKAEFVFKDFMVNTAALPVSVEEVLRMYFNAVVIEVNERAGAMGIAKGEMGNVRFEVVGNDLAIALPRSSFSRDSIILRSTNARFWSSGIDPSTSDFLQNGTFVDESRLSYGSALAGASAAKAQLSRRTELRNLRRQIKNQRARILSNRSQLFIDLRSATQQAQNYLHEGFQALPAAEDAVKIIHSKILHLDQQLEQLTQHLLKVDEALDEAKAEGEALNSGGRDSLQFLSSTPTNGSRRRSDSMEQIRHEVAGMSQHLMTPLFVAEDAEFHDARVASSTNMMSRGHGDAGMSTYAVGLFEFELVDLSGTTRDSASPLFHHSLLTGRIDLEPESLSEAALSSYFGISLSMNELSIGTGPEQYTTLLGMIYENFREVSRVVTEDTYPLCATCAGLHHDSEYCSAIWMRIPVKIADAALRISNKDHPVADLFWEQLELVFTLRTDDSVEFNGSALSFTTADIRPSRCQTASEIVRPLPGDGLQIEYNQKMNWTDAVYDLKVRNTNFLGVYPAFHDIIAFFAEPVLAEGEFLDFGVGYMSPPPPDWQKIDFFLTTSGCLFSLLEDFETTDARALVMLTDVVTAYSTHQKCKGATDMTKCHLEFDQHGVYFSQLPDLQLLGDVGELRLVLVNNSLGIPIADFHMREIVCEYIQDEDYSTTMGATLLFNYFNNSIYRWEPLVEPFVVQMRIHRALEENSLVEVFANLPNTVNFNMTPAMAPLLSSEALRQADFVTSGSKSTAPFWVENKTGLELKFSFRRGTGTVIQQIVPDNGKVSVDCREQGDMLTFDSASADRFLRETDRQALTVNHTLSVWLNGNKWVSTNPVVVDMVGHVAVPLRESLAPVVDADAIDFENGGEEDISPPTLVAEISIQADGSKLISLHSQVVLQNRTSVPLMVWAFSPREGGCIQEWIIDREQICHIPLQLVHPQSKISIRPSPYVQYAPLTTSLEELGDEVRAAKSVNTKRFVRAGNCVCNFETFATMEELQSAAKSLEMVSSSSMSSAIPLSGYVVRDLPTWKCTYEVEAYYLMRATFSKTEEPPPVEQSAVDLERVEEEEGEKVEDDFLHVFGEPAQRQRMNPLRDVNYELDEARAAGQRRGLYEATNSSLYYLSVSPFLTLHNRLATAMAYRLLNGSLQLIAEGILAVGNVLPLFQVDASELLYVSFRLENYSWSAPKLIINPKMSVYSVPYKETIEPVQLLGRAFDRDITGEQGSVPNLQLQVKLSGRDVIVFCSIWIVNHTDLDLEYCNSTSSSSKRLEAVLKYVHRRAGSSEEYSEDFSARSMSFHGEGGRETQLTRLHKVKPSTNPVAVIVVIREARDLYNAQFFGAQSPYVRASLYVLKNPKDRYLEKPEMVAICSTTTKPSPSGGLAPQWDARLQNTLLLRFPPEVRTLELARIIIEVRNVRYGLDTCLGVTAVKVDSILKDRKRAAAFNWYKLLKRKSSRERKASKNNLASIHRGDISISFSVGTSQELPSDMDAEDTVEEAAEEHSSIHDEEMTVSYLERQESENFELDDMEHSLAMHGQQTPGPLPSTSAARSLQRLQTPSSHDMGLIGAPTTMRARQAYTFSGEIESSHSQELLSYDPTSTRAMGALITNGSPTKPAHTGRPHGIQVYLPHNRFACVVVEVYSSSLMSEVFDLVCMKCGFVGVLDIEDFDFYELALPRFVSLRSAGRPEGERWYGQPIPMTSKIESKGRRHGLHLCHRITMTTIRLYDEASTASSHHVTPRSLVTSSKRSNPAQIRPMPWGDVLPYSSGGKHWDVLRIKSRSSPWSDVIRLNRNAMGNSGVAQVISLTNEVYDQDQESELRKGTQEVALWSCYGSGRFSETIMATVVPRYILINKTEETIKFRQFDAPKPSGWLPTNSYLSIGQVRRERNFWNRRPRRTKTLPSLEFELFVSFASSTVHAGDILDIQDWRGLGQGRGGDSRVQSGRNGNAQAYSAASLAAVRAFPEAGAKRIPTEEGQHAQVEPEVLPVVRAHAVLLCQRNGQELLGVVDLRTGSDVPGVGGVAIFEKAAEAPSKSGFISLNGLVSSISGSLFGGGSRQKNGGEDDDDDDGDDRSRELVRFAVSLTTSSVLCEESEKFVNAHIESGTFARSGVTRKGFYVNGQDLVDFLVTEMSTQTKAQAFTTAQEMMELGVLKPIQISSDVGAHKQAPLRSFQCSKVVWYSVDSINLSDDSDLDSEDSSSITTPRDCDLSTASSKAIAKPPVVGSNQFSIITPTKCYDLKAKNPKIAKIWVRRLRLATQGGQVDDIEEMPEETPMAGAPRTMRSQRDLVPQVQNAKTYVHVRIRADGPTKVLELFEGGEEDFDERENKYELSSTASASSDSPTASETSATAFESLTSGMALHLRVDGVGISCVNELPMELVYIYLGGISLHYSRVNSNMRMNVTLDDVQIDNQSEEATFTKLLCPRMENGAAAAVNPTRKRTIGDIDEDLAEMVSQGRGAGGGNGDDDSPENTGLISNQNIFSCADCKYRQANVAAMHFCCTWSNEQGNTDYFKHCSFWLYPVTTQLDEELLVSARAFMAAMTQSWGQNRSQNRGGEIRMKSIPIEMMMESLAEYRENTYSDELNPLTSLKSYTTTSTSETRKVYFALLHIHPMDFDITFRSDVFQTSTTISLHEAASFKKSASHADEMKRSSSAPSSFGDSNGDDSSSMTWAIPSLTMHVPDLDNAPVRLNALMIEHAFGTSGDLTRRVSKYYTRQLWKQLHKILGSFDFLGNPVGFLDHIGTGVRDFVYEPLEGLKIGGKGFSKGLAKGTASLMSNTVDGTFDAASKISGTFGQGFANLSLDDHYQQNRARARRRHVRGLREGLVQGSRELSLGVYEGVAGLVLNPMRGAQESGAVGFVKGTITGIIGLPVKPVAGIFDFASRATRVCGTGPCRTDRICGESDGRSVSAADLTREARDRRRSGSNGSSKLKSNDSTRERTNSLRRALQEDDERRRAAGELPNAGTGETSGRKLRYEVVFYHKKMGMDLETDFYCENVTIKAMDETSRSKVKLMQEAPTPKPDSSDGGEVEFGATSRARLRRLSLAGPGAGNDAVDESIKKLKVQLSHWLIVTEQPGALAFDTSLNGYLLKKGGFSTVRRWFVLSRNCLYYFTSRKQLRGIIPLGHVRLETDAGDARCLRITNATRSQPLVTLQLDSGQVVERVQSEVVLVAASTQELEMWQSSLAHAAGKGMRHSRGTRFFVPTAASRLEIGTQETPDFVVKPLAEALKKTVEELPTTRVFWVGVAAFRLWNALFVRTSFNPDEYWQSTEVAHRLVFGYGYLTWEWQDDAQLRGFAHPALFAGLYKLLELLNLDSRWAVAYGPRLMQGLISAANDFFLYKLARNYFDAKAAKWALLCQFFSWFTFYVMVRPFSNCVETLCTTAALAYWPWKFLEDGADKKNDDAAPVKRRNRALALVLAALGVLFRPTNAIIWLYPGIVHFLQTRDHAYLMFGLVMPIAIVTTLTMLCIDRLGYGEWTFVPFNFFKFNVLEGKDKLYGEHPWSWYFSQGYPAIVGTTLPIVIAGYLTVPSSKKDLGRVIMWALFVYSNAAHKEFRFVLPLLPPAFVYAGYCLRNLERKLYVQFRERTQWNLLRLAVFSVIVPNVLSAYYLSRSHQLSAPERLDVVPGLLAGQPRANRRLRVAPT